MFTKKDSKPGRTVKTTEPMNAVDIAEIAELATLDLDAVMGGCAACGCGQPDALQNPWPAQPAGRR